MTETLTSRLGLIKPARDTLTPLDIERLNLNSDSIDKAVGAAVVAAGIVPPTTEMYDGKIIKEKITDRVWIAEKQTNGSYLKRWITWPYLYTGYSASQFCPYGVYFTAGFLTTATSTRYALNSSASDNVGSYWVCPLKGVWNINIHVYWVAGSQGAGETGFRYSSISINDSPLDEDTNSSQISRGADFGGNLTTDSNAQLILNAGDRIAVQLFQNAVNPHRYDSVLRATMMHPIS